MTKKPSIIFRADADNKTGLGHIVRSSALAGMLSEEFNCILATKCQLQPVIDEVKANFNEIIILPQSEYRQEAEDFDKLFPGMDLVVLDGYHFETNYQATLVSKGFELFCIDDIHTFTFLSKAVINHSGGLQPSDYKAQPFTQFYLGPHYALLRKAFLRAAKNRRTEITDKNCFICFGGADPGNKTMEILGHLAGFHTTRFDHLHVVVGTAYSFRKELDDYVKGNQNISIHYSLSPDQMVNVMQQCSYAICSPSGIVYEYLTIGGIVFLEKIAENQNDVIRYFTSEGMAFHLEQVGLLQPSEVESAFQKAAYYFDGRSGERFLKLFSQYFAGRKITTRKAIASDLQCTFEWTNDPDVRMQSYNQNNIPIESHTEWFKGKLQDTSCYYYILELEGNPVAQVRFQLTGDEAVLGYLAGKNIRSKGLGTTILSKGIESFVNDYKKPVKITGYVKQNNIASQRSFEKLAFIKEETETYPDSFKYTMIYGN